MARGKCDNTDKMNRSEYLRRVAKRTGYSRAVVVEIYDAMVDEFVDVMQEGKQLLLTGFGNYYMQTHKGHPVQFAGGSDVVEDYDVLKFSPSNVLKKRVRSNDTVILGDDSK